jgi:hypothetical protein
VIEVSSLFAYGPYGSVVREVEETWNKTFYLEGKYFVFVIVAVEKVWQVFSKIMSILLSRTQARKMDFFFNFLFIANLQSTP